MVPAGGIVDFATPVTGRSGLGTASVVISAQKGMPIVVARLTTRYKTRLLEAVDVTPGTAGPHEEWVAAGGSLSPQVEDVLTLDDPGSKAATVTLSELSNGQVRPGAPRRRRASSQDRRWTSTWARCCAWRPSFALLVSANVPILVEQQLTYRGGLTASSGAIPVLP